MMTLNSENDLLKSFFITKNLYYAFLNYIKLILKETNILAYDSLSLPGLAMKYFRLFCYFPEKYQIENLTESKDRYIRQSYRGGYCDIVYPELLNGFHYDVNSLYPFCMLSDMPTGEGKWVDGSNINLNSFFGFCKIIIHKVPENLKIPFLTIKDLELGHIAPLGTWSGIYFSEEIKLAQTLGYKIEIINGIKYGRGELFSKFVNKFYDLRLKYPKISPLNQISKLFLNSLYGRFGMTLDHSISKLVSADITNKHKFYNLIFNFQITTFTFIKEKYLLSFDSNIKKDKQTYLTNLSNKILGRNIYNLTNQFSIGENSAVQIASAITAYGRIFMYQFLGNSSLGVCYTDTDSLFTKIPLSEEYISNTQLGFFKLENYIEKAKFISPKYYIIKTKNSDLSIKIKGVGTDFLTKLEIDRLLNKKEVNFNMDTLIRRKNLKNLSVMENFEKKNISGILFKRKKIFNKKGMWIDTKPIKIGTNE